MFYFKRSCKCLIYYTICSRHDIAEILLKLAVNTNRQKSLIGLNFYFCSNILSANINIYQFYITYIALITHIMHCIILLFIFRLRIKSKMCVSCTMWVTLVVIPNYFVFLGWWKYKLKMNYTVFVKKMNKLVQN
jgi:hypothetical protein